MNNAPILYLYSIFKQSQHPRWQTGLFFARLVLVVLGLRFFLFVVGAWRQRTPSGTSGRQRQRAAKGHVSHLSPTTPAPPPTHDPNTPSELKLHLHYAYTFTHRKKTGRSAERQTLGPKRGRARQWKQRLYAPRSPARRV
eukprot:scaffold19052_cov117-Isochrysis_galbana.AAC.4